MAHMNPEKAKRILKETPLAPHTPYSILDRDAFSLRLEEIRKNGYVLEREEAVEGILGIAAPIRDYSRQVIAALGAALPLVKTNSDKNLERVIHLVKAAGDAISSDLGYLKI